MIATDTSSLIAYLQGATDQDDVELIEDALSRKELVFPPMVVTELLSDPTAGKALEEFLAHLPLLNLSDGFWIRAGQLRAKVFAAGKKSRLADALIAQCCIDNKVPLVSRDRDFRHYEELGLRLL